MWIQSVHKIVQGAFNHPFDYSSYKENHHENDKSHKTS